MQLTQETSNNEHYRW